MKFIYYILMIMVVLSCQKEKTDEVEEMNQIAMEESTGGINNLPKLNADYLTSIYELQERIRMEQQSIELRKNYCERAYLQKNDVFISMGIARLSNPKDGKKIAQYYAERAAQIDAIRWATYGESWLKEDYQLPFGKLEKHFNRQYQIIDRAIVGDSLFLFIATNIDIKE